MLREQVADLFDFPVEVEPITDEQKRQVELATEHFIVEAEGLFEVRIDRIPILFDLKGHTAGMFKQIGDKSMIRYNPWIFSKYFKENMRDTVPHEVGHYVVHAVYGNRCGKPHGPRWQNVMALFGADAGVTFNLDLEGVPHRKQRTHPYFCGCMPHDVSSTRHNRILRGVGRYYCRTCDGELIYSGPD
ncbi:MAG: SprT protein [Halioglobus sp.]|jgi:SprT protein